MKYVLMKANKVDTEHIRAAAIKYAKDKYKLVVKRTNLLNKVLSVMKERGTAGDKKTIAKLSSLWRQLMPVLNAIDDLEYNFSSDPTVVNREGRFSYRNLWFSANIRAEHAADAEQAINSGSSDAYERVIALLKEFGQSKNPKNPPASSYKDYLPSSVRLVGATRVW